jgi:hypothetical protein
MMTHTELHPVTLEFLNAAPVDWGGLFEKYHDDSDLMREVISQLDHVATFATRVARYVGNRDASSASHNEAVRAQNQAATQVRKALRYTYPMSANFTF